MLHNNPKNHEFDIILDQKINEELYLLESKLLLKLDEEKLKYQESLLVDDLGLYYPVTKYHPMFGVIQFCCEKTLKDDDFKTDRGEKIEDYISDVIVKNIEEDFNLKKNMIKIKKTKKNQRVVCNKVITEDFFIMNIDNVFNSFLKYPGHNMVLVHVLNTKYYCFPFDTDLILDNIFFSRGIEYIEEKEIIKVNYRYNEEDEDEYKIITGIGKRKFGNNIVYLDLNQVSTHISHLDHLKLPINARDINLINKFLIKKENIKSLDDLSIICYNYHGRELFRNYYFAIEHQSYYLIYVPQIDVSLSTIKDMIVGNFKFLGERNFYDNFKIFNPDIFTHNITIFKD